MKRVLVLFSGSGTNLDNLIQSFSRRDDVDITHTLTNNKKADGVSVSLNNKVPCTIISSKDHSKEEYEKLLLEQIAILEYDLIVLAGYMKLVSKEFLQTAKSEVINIHPSLLPRHKGLQAIERSFEDEFDKGGVTVHFVNEEMDDGKIIMQKTIDKKDLDFNDYNTAVKNTEFEILPKAILQTLELE